MSMRTAVSALVIALMAASLVVGCSPKSTDGAKGPAPKEAAPDQKALGADLLNKAGGGGKGAPAAKAGGEETGGAEKAAEPTAKTE